MSDEVVQFIADMFETMYNADGIGLAANQVGSPLAITVMDLSVIEEDQYQQYKPTALINPVIEVFSEETIEFEEGCLSLPTLRDMIVRPEFIQVRYYDQDMKEHVVEADDMFSRVIQHEVDHLHGRYFFEYLSPVRRALAHPRLKRIQRGAIETEYPLYVKPVEKTTARAMRR